MSDESKRTPGGSFRELYVFLGLIVAGLIGLSVFMPSSTDRAPVSSPVTSTNPTSTNPTSANPTSANPKQAVANVEAPKVGSPQVETVVTKPAAVPKQVQVEAAKLDAKASESKPLVPATEPAKASPPPAATAAAPTAPAADAAPRPTFAARTEAAKQATAPSQVPTQVQAITTMKIQHVKSPGGIEAWLVEEHSVPLLALRFVFDGGSSQDPAGKEGVANFMTAMMDEGAGEYDHKKFQERMEELAFKMGFEDSRDAFYGSFETLSANREPSLEMLRLAVTKPRFAAADVDRIRQQLLASLAFAEKSPDKIAAKTWSANAFPGHPYGRPTDGTPASIGSITRDDIEAYRKRMFARDTLRVVAVGDITAKQLSDTLDHVFGSLPAKAELTAVPMTKPAPTEKLKVIEMDVPQSVVQFGMNGFARKDPDFLPAFILNQILGGGGFASRLTEEVREKRGLAYSVYSYLQPYKHVAIFGGGVATKNEEVGQSLDVIRAELKRMADDGPTANELTNAKSYLTGSFALRFDTNSKIASQLLWMLQEDMGIDYVEKRNALVDAVTLDDVKRVAKRLLTVDDLIVTIVGKPKGLSPRG